MNKIDVVICTKNSDKILEACLNSVYDHIPVCHLIVVDGFSGDKTIEIIKSFNKKFGNVKIIQSQLGLGKSREIGIKNVDSEWFVFIDSDVILREKWFKKISENVGKKVGAIESNFIHYVPKDSPKFPGYSENNIEMYTFPREKNDLRGYTIATLIKTDVVRNIKIPTDLSIYEDEFIKKWIEENRFNWVKAEEPIVDHYKEHPKPFRDAYLTGKYAIAYDIYPKWKIFFGFLVFPLKFLFFIYKYNSVEISSNLIKYNLYMIKGVLDEIFMEYRNL